MPFSKKREKNGQCPKCIEYEWADPQRGYGKENLCVFHQPKNNKYAFAKGEKKKLDLNGFNGLVFERLKAGIEGGHICRFSGTIFPGDITFQDKERQRGNEFPSVSFYACVFHGDTSFQWITFLGITDFRKTTFEKRTDFSISTAKDSVSFEEAIFNDLAEFSKITSRDNGYELHGLTAESLQNVNFTHHDTSKLSFTGGKWPEKLWMERNCDKKYRDRKSKGKGSLFFLKEYPEYEKCEEVYRSLKIRATRDHDQCLISRWHFREKQMYRKRYWWRRYIPLTPTWIYWAFSGFGERPGRAFAALLFLFLSLSLLLGLLEMSNGVEQGVAATADFGLQAYFRLLRLAFEQVLPVKTELAGSRSWGGVMVTLIAKVLIPIQVALLMFALRNRFRR